jgi:peptidoglycan/LPS O-acetylase OafA/YrhL
MNSKILHHPNYRPEIDGLRAFAVLFVILFHAFPEFIPGGFIGVDIFFVISGYLITTIILTSLHQKTFTFSSFIKKRILRIFPALFIVLISCFIFGWFALYAFEYKELARHIFGGSFFVSNFMYWKEISYFDKSSELKPLLHLWSLSIEEQFYLIWPLTLLASYKAKFKIFFVVGLIFLCSFISHFLFLIYDGNIAFYHPQLRVWEFLAGSLATIIKSDFKTSSNQYFFRFKNLSSLIGLVLIISGAFFIKRDFLYPGLWALLFPVIGSMLIISAPKLSLINRTIFSNRLLVWIGLISYPLYLWHWPLLSLSRIIEGHPLSNTVKFLLIILSIILSALTYYLIEKPIRFTLQNKLKEYILFLLVIIVGLFGYVVDRHDGYGKRQVNLTLQSFDSFKEDFIDPEFRSKGWLCSKKNTEKSHCIYNEGSKPTADLIGDSHSVPLYFGLKDIYEKKGKSLALYGGSNGCPPLLNVISGDIVMKSSCIESTTNALINIAADDSINEIILMNRGPVYTSGNGYGDVSAIKNWIIKDLSNPLEEDRNKIFAQSLDNTLSMLERSKKKIIYLHNEPELGFDIRTCIMSHPIKFTAANGFREPCAVDKLKFLERNKIHRDLVNDVLKKHLKVKSVDLSDALCDLKYCYGKDKNYLYYRDDNHLSVRGAKFIGNKLQDQF